jgi:hypothetical protein
MEAVISYYSMEQSSQETNITLLVPPPPNGTQVQYTAASFMALNYILSQNNLVHIPNHILEQFQY